MTRDARPFIIKVEGGHDIGMGHVQRSLTLAEHLQDAEVGPIRFWSNERVEAIERIHQSGFSVLGSGDRPLLEKLPTLEPAGVLFDQPSKIGPLVQSVHQNLSGTWLGALDCFEMGLSEIDLIINLFNHAEDHSEPIDSTVRYLEGLDYAILRDTFRSSRRDRVRGAPMERLLITFGGSDPSNNTRLTLEALPHESLEGVEVEVVIGPWFEDSASVEKIVQETPFPINLHRDPADLDSLMANADLAISGAGTTVLELAYLGVPTVVLPQTDLEHRFARFLHRRGIVHLVERDMPSTAEPLKRTIRAIVQDPVKRERLSEAAREAVDGRGAFRIAEEISVELGNR